MYKKLVEVGDATAMTSLGLCYDNGGCGLRRDRAKALELWHKAGELGCAAAYYNIGNAYYNGRGVERDKKKVAHYYELAAMGGDEITRYYLGCMEYDKNNWDRAIKHYMIAAGSGYNGSVKSIQLLYTKGDATKEDYKCFTSLSSLLRRG